jgi:hypothetical protein
LGDEKIGDGVDGYGSEMLGFISFNPTYRAWPICRARACYKLSSAIWRAKRL